MIRMRRTEEESKKTDGGKAHSATRTLFAHIRKCLIMNGAGDGNRTHMCSLEGCRSTIELHPQLYQLELVEGGGFEPPKAEPADLQSDPFGRSGTPPISGNLCIILYL